MMKQQVKEHENWYRDSQSGSLHCASKSDYEKYMKAHNAKMKKEQEHLALQNDVSQLKSDMSDIKSLLLTLVQNQNHDS